MSILTLGLHSLDTFVIVQFFPHVSELDIESVKAILGSLVSAIIWIPYMLVSRRVKATFVH